MYKNSYYMNKISLSDKKTIRYLILNRITLDPLYGSSSNSSMFHNYSDIYSFNTALSDIYVSLDSIIEECRFNRKRIKLLELLFEGYSISDICGMNKEFRVNATGRMLNRVINDIIKMNNKMFANVINKSKK